MYTDDYYAVLGLEPDATHDQIKEAYRTMCKVHHPDVGGDEALMQLLNKAYITLSNAKLRENYDREYNRKSTKESSKETKTEPSSNGFVNAMILGFDGAVFSRRYSANAFSMNLDKYKDSEGIIYIFDDKRVDKRGKYTILKKYLWEYKLAHYKNYESYINCYIYSEKNGMSTSNIQISKLHFDCTDHITEEGFLYVITYKDDSVRYFHSFDEWNSAKNQMEIVKRNKTSKIYSIIAVTLLLCFVFFYSTFSDSDFSNETDSVPQIVEQNLPEHGTARYNIKKTDLRSYIDFKTNGMTSKYCYIVAIDADTDEQIQSAFVYTQNGYRMRLPLGKYKLFYSCGDKWYGYKHLFGPEGGYTHCDSEFALTADTYYQVTLYSVVDGNMETDDMSYDEFLDIIN